MSLLCADRSFIISFSDDVPHDEFLQQFDLFSLADDLFPTLRWIHFQAFHRALVVKPLHAVRAPARSGGRYKWTEAQRFTVGAPIIYPESFFGRTRELAKLFGLLRGPQLQNGAVIGPRYMGKTSLLRYVAAITRADPTTLRPGQKQNWLPHADRYVWVYVDLRDSRLHTPKLLLSYILLLF